MNLQAVYNYCVEHDIDIFANCETPAPIDIDLLKSYIMRRCGLLTPIYGEPLLFKMQTKMWFDSNYWRMEHLVKMLLADYQPHENIFDRDHWTEKHSGEDTLTHGEKHTLGGEDTLTHGEKHTLSGEDTLTYGEKHTLGGTDTFTHGEKHVLSGTDSNTDTTNTEHKVSAFNASNYQPSSEDTNSGGVSTTYGKTDTASGDDKTKFGKTDTASGTDTTGYGKTDTASGTDTTGYGKTDTASGTDTTGYGKTDTASGTDTTGYGKTDTASGTDITGYGKLLEYNRDRHGNVGVKSSSDLMQEELNLLERFNVYDTLSRWFEEENMIQVY